MYEKEEKTENENKNIEEYIDSIENEENIKKTIGIRREIVGPKIKKRKNNKKEDKEIQIACEDPQERKERLKEEKIERQKEKQKKKEEELKNKNLIYKIDEENYLCVDCGKVKSSFLSINNGVTICYLCAQEHQLLGHSISYLKNINDQLDEYLFNFIVFGSNTRFKQFIEKEKMEPSLSITKKYKTKAIYFYRKLLKNKVLENEAPLKDYEDPNEIVKDNNKDEYPEFNKYKIKNQIIQKGQFKKESKIKNILNKIISLGEGGNKKNNQLLLRARSSMCEKLKKDGTNTIEGDENDNVNIYKQKPPVLTYDNDKLKESSRPINNETQKTDENEETQHAQQTSEQITEK